MNETIPCLLTDQQLQLETVINFMLGTPHERSSGAKYCPCCNKLLVLERYPRWISTFEQWLSVAAIFDLEQIKTVNFWLLTSKSKGSTAQHIAEPSDNNFNYCIPCGDLEVIKLTSSSDSPLCSVLTAGGTLSNVIDFDWIVSHRRQTK
jgi:hypothetical protein